jgi:hypothetical protein
MSCAGTTTGRAGNCGCGDNGGDAGGCGLTAPVQPRFFCGQLLTDTDLTTLTDWVVTHRRLDRFRDGQGVVCGLWLRADPDRPSGILVDPGVAVSGCGDDIVVPATARLDLATICGPTGTSCADLSTAGADCTRVVDIGLRFAENGADPVLSLGGGSCGQSGACEDSRLQESYALVPTRAVPGSMPDTTGYAAWEQGYRAAVGVVEWAVRDGLPGEVDRRALADWLLARIAERPLTRFRFLPGAVAGLASPAEKSPPERFAWLLFWLALDRLLAFLAGECPVPPADEPVRLGRVWLRVSDQSWTVVAVDTVAPLRAPLSTGQWPAPPGRLNLARAIWQDREVACLALRDLGVPLRPGAAWTPTSVAEVWRLLKDPPVVPCGTAVSPRWLTVPDEAYVGGTRVVGFLLPDVGSPCPGNTGGDTPSPGDGGDPPPPDDGGEHPSTEDGGEHPSTEDGGEHPSIEDGGGVPSTEDSPAPPAEEEPAPQPRAARKAPATKAPATRASAAKAAAAKVPAKKAPAKKATPAVRRAAPVVKAVAPRKAGGRATGQATRRGPRSQG